jgi:hypothetical protein
MPIVEKYAADFLYCILLGSIVIKKNGADDVDGLPREQRPIPTFLRASRCLKDRRIEYALLTTMGLGFVFLCPGEFRLMP